ncbi:hypothetical protein ACHAAC_16780 [Aeromicrobium sp. CF4.19]|uniref:hypothetical protein n=1 Tax=Aeromicrobium sp. CF4.19 TaxID=3373082 RepID=UPI003EE6A249
MRIEEREDGAAEVTLQHALAVLTLVMREQRRGDGDWRLVHVAASPHDGDDLTPGLLRDLPLASTVESARAQLAARRQPKFWQASHLVPEAWLGDRRGRPPRTPRDWAGLALAYSAAPEGARRRALPREWAARHGGSVATWQDRVSDARAKGYLDDSGVTPEALEVLGFDGDPDAPGGPIWRALVALGLQGATHAERHRTQREWAERVKRNRGDLREEMARHERDVRAYYKIPDSDDLRDHFPAPEDR